MMRKILILTALMAMLISAASAGALSPEQLKNAEYQGIYDKPIQLMDGRYEGEPFVQGGASRPSVTWQEGLTAFGDLNGDGLNDAALVLIEDSGGSGTFSYLAIVLNQDEQPINQATLLLGDRVNVKSIAIENARVQVDVIDQNEIVRKYYQYTFAESSSEKLGALSVSALEGVEWVLTTLSPAQGLVADTEITAVFSEDKIGGSSGCNHYSATVTEQGEATLKIGPTMGTRKACPEAIMTQEHAFLAALETVGQFSFSSGQLLLKYDKGSLLFQPRRPEKEDEMIASLKALEGTKWILTELESGRGPVPDTEITVEFADGKISGSNGCNTYSADITEKGLGMLSIGMAMGTMKACPKAVMDQENEFMAKLVNVSQARLVEGHLELLHEHGKLIFTQQPTDGM